jgi:hypothetical protein
MEASWKSCSIVVMALLGDGSAIRRRSVPVAEREAVFAGKRYAEQDDSRCRNGGLLNGAFYDGLHYLMRSVANRAIRMHQSIGMKVGLLNRGADEEKDGAHDGKQNVSARFGHSILPLTAHRNQYIRQSMAATNGNPVVHLTVRSSGQQNSRLLAVFEPVYRIAYTSGE